MAMETLPPVVQENTPMPRQTGPSLETILYLVLFLLAIGTRLALLGAMALHHDEGIHARFGWDVYRGTGWTHDAVYHGPVIYHAGALGFYLFGDSDATARITFALTSIATVMLPFLLRRQLGRWGALLASLLLLISPSFLYFGRFGHPDVFGVFFSLLCFVCIVRYMDDRKTAWLYGAALATSLHFCAKPTAYIVTAIFLVYLAGQLLWERYDLHALWPVIGLIPAVGEMAWKMAAGEAFPLQQISVGPLALSVFSLVPLALALSALVALLVWRWYEGWSRQAATGLPLTIKVGTLRLQLERRQMPPSPTLDLLVVLGTMVLPLLSAVLLNALVSLRQMPALDYRSPTIAPEVVTLAVIAIGTMFALAGAIGARWDYRRWLVAAGLFWGVFFVLHTSFFVSMTGWATGLVQALGFWLTQQDVKRIHVGPQYYLILMSTYETVVFLFGWLGAAYLAWKGLAGRVLRGPLPQKEAADPPAAAPPLERNARGAEPHPAPAISEPASCGPLPLAARPSAATGLVAFWTPVAFLMYSFAGEQVPWLTIHPTLPFVLAAAALLGRIVAFRPRRAPAAGRRRGADGAVLAGAVLLLVWAGRPFLEALRSPAQDAPAGSAILALVSWGIAAALLAGLSYLAFAGGERPAGEAPFGLLGAVALVMAGLSASALSFAQDYDAWYTLYVPLALFLVVALARVALLGKMALRSIALLLLAFLGVYGLANAFRLTYINNDTPVEMIVYVQSGSDVQWAMDNMAALSTLMTGGRELAFLYDSDVAWPFEWYLRNYTRKIYQPTITGPPAQDVALAFVYRDKDHSSKPYLESRFEATRFYIFNWWFPEDTYRNAQNLVERVAPELLAELVADDPTYEVGLRDVARGLLSGPGQVRAWRYLMFREIGQPLGAREFAFYVRHDLVGPLRLLQDSIPRR